MNRGKHYFFPVPTPKRRAVRIVGDAFLIIDPAVSPVLALSSSGPSRIGPMLSLLEEKVIRGKPHPEQGYRSCLGINEPKSGPADRDLYLAISA